MTPELLMPISPRVLPVCQADQKWSQRVVSSSPLPPRTQDRTGFYSNLTLKHLESPLQSIKHKRKPRDSHCLVITFPAQSSVRVHC